MSSLRSLERSLGLVGVMAALSLAACGDGGGEADAGERDDAAHRDATTAGSEDAGTNVERDVGVGDEDTGAGAVDAFTPGATDGGSFTGHDANGPAPADLAALCAQAIPITLGAMSVDVTVTVPSGEGVIDPGAIGTSCTGEPGAEVAFVVTIPAGLTGGELQIGTHLTSEMSRYDPVIYLGTSCAEPEITHCNDDREGDTGGDRNSDLRIPDAQPGTYYVFLDAYEPLDSPIEAGLSFRLFRAAPLGAACDPQGIGSVCATGLVCNEARNVCEPGADAGEITCDGCNCDDEANYDAGGFTCSSTAFSMCCG